MTVPVLTLAGLWNSGPAHWQTHWERSHPTWKRVPHREYESPRRDEWVEELERAVAACDAPPMLAAHSMSCCLVQHWAAQTSLKAAAAFLVAPSDVEATTYPKGPAGFKPMPLRRLPFPSLVVTSTTDEYISLERARFFASAWGSELVVVSNAGHLNGDAGYGPWPEGLTLLESLIDRAS